MLAAIDVLYLAAAIGVFGMTPFALVFTCIAELLLTIPEYTNFYLKITIGEKLLT